MSLRVYGLSKRIMKFIEFDNIHFISLIRLKDFKPHNQPKLTYKELDQIRIEYTKQNIKTNTCKNKAAPNMIY